MSENELKDSGAPDAPHDPIRINLEYNPKPDTAQGVSDLMKQAFVFAEDKGRAELGLIHDPDSNQMVNTVLTPDGRLDWSLQEYLDKRAPSPRVRSGTANFSTLESFINHAQRFGDGDSAVFVDPSLKNPKLVSVLDYHRADTLSTDEDQPQNVHGEYRWCRHRGRFEFPLSDEWNAWKGMDREVLSMTEFAAFLENHVLDVAEVERVPASAERFVEMMGGTGNIADWSSLMKLSKTLTVYENATVQQTVNLDSGAMNITIGEEHETEIAGVTATVPTMFFIDIPLFVGGVKYRLPVRLRWRKGRSSVSFFYELWNADQAFRDAIDEAVARVANETPATVFYGTPEA